jgi:asparagine N-glycosylation enzyme membrane subunit Stt3
MTSNAWQIMLWAAAAYNLVIGGGGLVARRAPRESRLVNLFVAAFGIVYAIAATDLVRFAPVLWAGVFGKLGVIALLAPAVARGELPRAVGWILAGDALFTAAFLAFLLGG